MNVEHTELAIEHTVSAIGSGLKALLHFFAANTSALTKAAETVETATGNPELIPLTEMIGKAVQVGTGVLDAATNSNSRPDTNVQ